MNTDSPALLERILRALPVSSQQRLLIMGWEEFPPPRDPARLLLRAIGAPTPVHLVDIEFETERWLGQHIQTQGVIQAASSPGAAPSMGRISLCLSLLPMDQLLLAQRHTERCRLTGILLDTAQPAAADPSGSVASSAFPARFQPASLASLAVVSISTDRTA